MAIKVYHENVDPFYLGYQHGREIGLPCSRREAEEYFADKFPKWGDREYTLYLNGRDDGIRGDTFRLKA